MTAAGAVLSVCAGLCLAQSAPQKVPAQRPLILVWSDEFNGPDGSPPDPAKWHMVSQGSGFGNDELQYYTQRPMNVYQEKGNLVITARKEKYVSPDGIKRAYTSARLETKGLFEQQYGRVEARIKLPGGQGIWPAFWMMGSSYKDVDWPACGEIDIMEKVGFEPSTVHGTLHAEGFSGPNSISGQYTLPDHARFSDDFHRFAIEWELGEIRFYVDDVLYETQNEHTIPAKGRWGFDHPFFVLLNVAVGGQWPGSPDKSTAFPASMLVDYVRVYRFADAEPKTGAPQVSTPVPDR